VGHRTRRTGGGTGGGRLYREARRVAGTVGTRCPGIERRGTGHVDTGTADAESDLATYAREIEATRQATLGHSLDETFIDPRRNAAMSLRFVYSVMIQEYARHNGHADLLRERIDGLTGH